METKQGIKIKRVIIFIILFMLAMPFFQAQFNLVKLTPLKGSFDKSPNCKLTFHDWFSGNYQKEKENYTQETFGFRSVFIRINNQIEFSLFKKTKANGVIIGKKNFLFEKSYIRSYFGNDFIGYDSIRHRMQRVKYLEDTLKKLDKNLILVIGPGKGFFYPEYIPENFKSIPNTTNYKVYIDYANDLGISYIDFNGYFLENKIRSPYPLYSQYGIHWSYYGMCIAGDSMIRFIEKIRDINMPNLCWDKIVQSKPNENDYDIADGMNILFKLRSFKMAYPQFQIQSNSNLLKPRVLIIADSFYWGMFNFGISKAFSNSHFWFYNRQIYPDSYKSELNTNQISLKDEIARHDVIIILATEANLSDFGWGFIEDAYGLFSAK